MLTYDESAALMNDDAFRGRVKVACLHFANYILDEASSVPAHNVRLRWAQRAFASPDGVASEVMAPVVMDGQVQADGGAITDDALQSSVETIVNKMM